MRLMGHERTLDEVPDMAERGLDDGALGDGGVLYCSAWSEDEETRKVWQ